MSTEQCLNTVRSQNTNRALTITDSNLCGKVNTEETEVKEGTENNSQRNEGGRVLPALESHNHGITVIKAI